MPPPILPSPLLQRLSQATITTPALQPVSKAITTPAPLMPKPSAQPPLLVPLSPSVITAPLHPAPKVSTMSPPVITIPLQSVVPLRPLTLLGVSQIPPSLSLSSVNTPHLKLAPQSLHSLQSVQLPQHIAIAQLNPPMATQLPPLAPLSLSTSTDKHN